MSVNNDFDALVDSIKSLPTIGTKTAKKIAFFLVGQDQKYIDHLLLTIVKSHKNINKCSSCNNLSLDINCNICSNSARDRKQLCLISSVEDLHQIESSNSFYGIYYVLSGEVSHKKNNDQIKNEIIERIIPRIEKDGIKEILLALNLTIDGRATSKLIFSILSSLPVDVYQIGFGMPINSSIDYADSLTLQYAIKNKQKLQ